MYKTDKPQGYIVQHREVLFCNNFKWSISYKNTDPLCSTTETYIILQINYTSIKNKEINQSFPDNFSEKSKMYFCSQLAFICLYRAWDCI